MRSILLRKSVATGAFWIASQLLLKEIALTIKAKSKSRKEMLFLFFQTLHFAKIILNKLIDFFHKH